MTDDESMDHLLREAMAAEAPQLSAGFDASVMAGVRKRRLTPIGRGVMGAYTIGALAMLAWATQVVGVAPMALSTLAGALAALGLSGYARALTVRTV